MNNKGIEMNCKYYPESHQYTLDDKPVQSVTEIASAVCGKNTDFMAHDAKVQAAAALGTDVHTELADYFDPNIKDAELTLDKSKEIAAYLDQTPDLHAEVIVYNSTYGYAGTADIVAYTGLTVHTIIDFKTMDKPDKKYCQVQLSLYKLALEDMGYTCDDTDLMVICPKGKIKLKALSWEEIQDMMPALLEIDDEDIERELVRMDAHLSMLKPFADDYAEESKLYKAKLVELMESAKATKYIGKNFTSSYVKESTRVSLDTEKLKAEFPEAYEACKKETKVAGFVKLNANE